MESSERGYGLHIPFRAPIKLLAVLVVVICVVVEDVLFFRENID
jgi:hypothetical protein